MASLDRRHMVPECIKSIVVSNVKDNYEFLTGAFDVKKGKTREKREEILKSIFDKVTAKEELEKIQKQFTSKTQMWTKFCQWKGNNRKKEQSEGQTGASPCPSWQESDRLLWHIRHEHDAKIKKFKCSVPCTGSRNREVTDSSSSSKSKASLHSLDSIVLTHKEMKENRAESKRDRAAKLKDKLEAVNDSPSKSASSKSKKRPKSSMIDYNESPSDLENTYDDPNYSEHDADSDSSNNSSAFQPKRKKKKGSDKKKIQHHASKPSSKPTKKVSSNEKAFQKMIKAIEDGEDIPLVSLNPLVLLLLHTTLWCVRLFHFLLY